MTSTSRSLFRQPQKLIKDRESLVLFGRTKAKDDIIHFLKSVTLALKTNDDFRVSVSTRIFMKFLCSIESCINVEVYCDQSTRYGNKEFRVWHQKVEKLAQGLFDELLSPELSPATVELCPYLLSSFGDLVRLDYDIFSSRDFSAIGGIIFPKYTSIVQKLLMAYRLEPAGSKGAWGLDDYFFLSFYWGSAQLISQNLLTPSCILDKNIVEAHKNQYAYFACVAFIVKLKGLPISQTAPLLNDISHLHSWTKINDGLLKMYEGECLSKLPIMQHVLFGSLLRFEAL